MMDHIKSKDKNQWPQAVLEYLFIWATNTGQTTKIALTLIKHAQENGYKEGLTSARQQFKTALGLL